MQPTDFSDLVNSFFELFFRSPPSTLCTRSLSLILNLRFTLQRLSATGRLLATRCRSLVFSAPRNYPVSHFPQAIFSIFFPLAFAVISTTSKPSKLLPLRPLLRFRSSLTQPLQPSPERAVKLFISLPRASRFLNFFSGPLSPLQPRSPFTV